MASESDATSFLETTGNSKRVIVKRFDKSVWTKRFAIGVWALDTILTCVLVSLLSTRVGVEAPESTVHAEVAPEPPIRTDVSPESVGRAVGSFDEGELAGDRATLTINGVEFAFRYCSAGEFMMGSPESEEGRKKDETQHKVVLTKGYWLMETELTQAQWEAITGDNPSYFKGENLPVEQISWNDCEAFVKKLNLNAAPEGWRFSLPTEAQWEYACRAGTTTPFFFGDSLNGDKANCDGNYPYGTRTKGPCLKETSHARSYAPNDWGLYDMCGNVWEWCKDGYRSYPNGAATDPEEPNEGLYRVRRGGGWNGVAKFCRSACRYKFVADGRDYGLGARLALVSTTSDRAASSRGSVRFE